LGSLWKDLTNQFNFVILISAFCEVYVLSSRLMSFYTYGNVDKSKSDPTDEICIEKH